MGMAVSSLQIAEQARGGGGRGPAGVEGQVRHDFFQLLPGDAVVERGLQVERQLAVAAQRDQAGDRHETAVPFVQCVPLPHFAEQHAVREIGQRRHIAEGTLALAFQRGRHRLGSLNG
jgi:hypothetical protein